MYSSWIFSILLIILMYNIKKLLDTYYYKVFANSETKKFYERWM